jgi:hypothetical protein
MRFLSRLFGFDSSDDQPSELEAERKIWPDEFSFENLFHPVDVEQDGKFVCLMTHIIHESFPDDRDVEFNIGRAVESSGYRYVEVIPTGYTGYEKYVLVIQNDEAVAGYSFGQEMYTLLWI